MPLLLFFFFCFSFFPNCSLVEKCLGSFVDEKRAKLLKEKCKPLEGCALVAGRTDKGVSALQQVCSFCMLFIINSCSYKIRSPIYS